MGPDPFIEIAQTMRTQSLFASPPGLFQLYPGEPSLLAGIFPRLALVLRKGGGFPSRWTAIVGAIGSSGAPPLQIDVDCARAALALVPDAVAG